LIFDERFIKLDDCRTRYNFEEFNLTLGALLVFLGEDPQVHCFEGKLLVCCFVSYQVHNSCCALSEFVKLFKPANSFLFLVLRRVVFLDEPDEGLALLDADGFDKVVNSSQFEAV
jgi:hypothetical protein